jgi:predicted DNA-binding transcriptional regulator AlpA
MQHSETNAERARRELDADRPVLSTPPFELVTREKAVRVLSISLGTLDHLIETGVLPPPRSLGSSRRLYWHPDIFYGCLDQLLRSDTGVTGAPDADEAPRSPERRDSKLTVGNRLSNTELRSVRHARDRDAMRLADLNK